MAVISAGYIGDFAAGAVVDFHFTTIDNALRPGTLTGSPVVSIFQTNSSTPSTAGVTLTADFASITGLNHVRITTVTDGTFYAAARHFSAIITTGNVGGDAREGCVVASFSISARPVQGLASGVITATSIASDAITDAKVASDVTIASVTGAVGSVTGAVGSVTGSVGSVATGGITAASIAADAITAAKVADGTIDAATFATGAITAAAIAADAIGASELAADAVTEIADGILKRDMSAVTGESARSPLNALRFLRNKWSISGSTLTVTKEDDSTSAWTSALTTSGSADPVTGSDPA